MSLFNFNNFDSEENDEFDEYQEIVCQCDNCSIENTLEIVDSFTNMALQADSPEELHQIMYQFAEMAKIQGVKEYIFEGINLQHDALFGLDTFTKSYYEQNSVNDSGINNKVDINDDFKDYGGTDIPHWKDRL